MKVDCSQGLHCLHTTENYLSLPPKRKEVCCFCGETKIVEDSFVPAGAGHGPYAPRGLVTWEMRRMGAEV